VIFAAVITGCEKDDLIENYGKTDEQQPEMIKTVDSIMVIYKIEIPAKDLRGYSEDQTKFSTISIQAIFLSRMDSSKSTMVIEKRVNLINGFGFGQLWVKTDNTMGAKTYSDNGIHQELFCYQYKAEKFNKYLTVEFYFNGIIYPSNGPLFFVYDIDKFHSFDL